jgi:uncharacterized integral membrane protein (TIGR00698 family)
MTESGAGALARLPKTAALLLGVGLVALLALAARATSGHTGPVPDVVVGLVAGALLGNLVGVPAELQPGIAFVLRYILRAAIILFGLGLSIAAVVQTGGATLVLVLACFTLALGLGYVVARVFRLNVNVGTLLGAGTAICGASAILAIGPLLRASDEEIAYALTTIFTFNVAALIAFPLIGHALGLSDTTFGSWTGTAVNDTSVVVATGYSYSALAGGVATIVKLTRTVLLVPLALAIGIVAARRNLAPGTTVAARVRATVPWFVLGFVAAAALRSSGAVPVQVLTLGAQLASFLILMVLVAVGLSVDIRKMATLGARPLAAGLVLASVMAGVSFGLVSVLGIR